MVKYIALCDGHGDHGVTPGKRMTLPDGTVLYENAFNKVVVKYLKVELERCGFKTLLVAPTDADTPLEQRTALANKEKVDLYISIHANANTGKFGTWGGIETFCYLSGESKRIADILHKQLLCGSKLSDRKVKDGSHLWVIKKTKMPSILCELGFMDSHNDYKYLISDTYRKECAVEIAKGVCEAYGVVYKEEVIPKSASEPTNVIRYIYTGGHAYGNLEKVHTYLFKAGHGFDVKRGSDGSIIFLVGPYDTGARNYKDSMTELGKFDKHIKLLTREQVKEWR